MPKWNRDEIEAAFDHYRNTTNECGSTGDWNPFVDLFTTDATYIDHVLGTHTGREAIRAFIVPTMAVFPAKLMTSFRLGWHVVDCERGWVVCAMYNQLTDPGDGTVFEAPNWTVLHYAGDNLWSCEEDNYSPFEIAQAVTEWGRHARGLDTPLDDDVVAGLAALDSSVAGAVDDARTTVAPGHG
ncbi:nuclear transport factor 2 family protein [Mycobacterium sp. PDNC021]|uniref:nuclear transport factor 2 family protein n=1 Tax=Mycobacterium sp. PDNC021 TaxID=3391399 RepID=UPI003AAA201A